MISNRPARLSVNPDWISSGDEPSSTTFSGSPACVSASHSNFTRSGQSATFWISSSTSTAPALFAFALSRAPSHCCSSHVRSRNVGSSAEA